jgi:hypothetical protein
MLVVAVTAGVLPRALHAPELKAVTPRADRKPGTAVTVTPRRPQQSQVTWGRSCMVVFTVIAVETALRLRHSSTTRWPLFPAAQKRVCGNGACWKLAEAVPAPAGAPKPPSVAQRRSTHHLLTSFLDFPLLPGRTKTCNLTLASPRRRACVRADVAQSSQGPAPRGGCSGHGLVGRAVACW